MALTVPTNDLSGETIASTFAQLLFLDNTDGMHETTLRVVSSEIGRSCLQLAAERVLFKNGADTTSSTFFDIQVGTDSVFKVNSATPYMFINEDKIDMNIRFSGDTETNLLYLDAGLGWVGIGTSTPDCALHVAAAAGNPSVVTNGGHDYAVVTGQHLQWGEWTVGTTTFLEHMRVVPSGYETGNVHGVGIGTTQPGHDITPASETNLTIAGANPSFWIQHDQTNEDEAGCIYFTEDDKAFGITGGYGFKLRHYGNPSSGGGALQVWSGAQTVTDCRLSIVRDTGAVGLGIADPLAQLDVTQPNNAIGLRVTQTISTDTNAPIAWFKDEEGTMESGEQGVVIQADVADPSSAAYYFLSCWDDTASMGWLTAANATQINTAFTAASDVRYKKDIEDWDFNGLEVINALKLRTFTYNDVGYKGKHDGMKSDGFIADEVYEVWKPAADGTPGQMKKELIEGTGSTVKDNNPKLEDGSTNPDYIAPKYNDIINPMGVTEGAFIRPMIKAIQELSAKVTALENA